MTCNVTTPELCNALRDAETKRIDEKFIDVNDKFAAVDVKYQIQFNAAEKAVGIASTAQEKLVAQALDGTKEAINKADVATDKRFSLLSEKIDGVVETISKNTGAQGIYVTHTDLNIAMEKLTLSIEATLRPVVAFMNSQTGQQKGVGLSWGLLINIVSLCGVLVAIFFALR